MPVEHPYRTRRLEWRLSGGCFWREGQWSRPTKVAFLHVYMDSVSVKRPGYRLWCCDAFHNVPSVWPACDYSHCCVMWPRAPTAFIAPFCRDLPILQNFLPCCQEAIARVRCSVGAHIREGFLLEQCTGWRCWFPGRELKARNTRYDERLRVAAHWKQGQPSPAAWEEAPSALPVANPRLLLYRAADNGVGVCALGGLGARGRRGDEHSLSTSCDPSSVPGTS